MVGKRTRSKGGRTTPGGSDGRNERAGEDAEQGAVGTGDTPVSGPVIAAILDITEQRVRQLVDEGLPRIGRGLYPLKGCVHWYLNYWKSRALGREGDADKKLKTSLETQLLQSKVQEATGHLINRQEVVMIVSAAFLRLGKMMNALPTSLGREMSWAPDTIRIVRKRLDEARENYVRDSAEFIDVVEDPPDAVRSKKRA